MQVAGEGAETALWIQARTWPPKRDYKWEENSDEATLDNQRRQEDWVQRTPRRIRAKTYLQSAFIVQSSTLRPHWAESFLYCPRDPQPWPTFHNNHIKGSTFITHQRKYSYTYHGDGPITLEPREP